MTSKSNKKESEESQEQAYVIPDGGYGWVVLFAAFFVSFILDGVMYAFGFLLVDIKTQFGASQETVNLISSLNTGFIFCSGPVVSSLCSQFGIRIVVMIGGLITAAMYLIAAYAGEIVTILVTVGIIAGISTGCTYIASIIIIADYFDKKRGIATGITMAGSGVGACVFSQVIKMLLAKFDWKFTLVILSCIILQCTLMGSLLRPIDKTPPKKPKRKDVELQDLNHAAPRVSVTVQTFMGSIHSVDNYENSGVDRETGTCTRIKNNVVFMIFVNIFKEMTDFKLMKDSIPFLIITISNFFVFAGYFVPFIFIPVVAKKLKVDATWILSIVGIINIPARIVYGFLADRRYIPTININTMCVAVGTACLFFYMALGTLGLQFIFSVLFAISIAGINSLTTPYLCEMVGLKRFGNATGIINLFRGFGCFIGPFVGGIISERTGNPYNAFLYAGGCFAAGLFLTTIVSFTSCIQDKCCKKKKSNTSYDEVNQDDH